MLNKIVEVITRNHPLWMETMLQEEHGLQTNGRHPVRLALAPLVPVRTVIQTFLLAEANEALSRLRHGRLQGAAVLMMS